VGFHCLHTNTNDETLTGTPPDDEDEMNTRYEMGDGPVTHVMLPPHVMVLIAVVAGILVIAVIGITIVYCKYGNIW